MPKVSSDYTAPNVKDLADIPLFDIDFDKTSVDLSHGDMITLTQIAEDGQTHTVILSAQMLLQFAPLIDLWNSQYSPPQPLFGKRTSAPPPPRLS